MTIQPAAAHTTAATQPQQTQPEKTQEAATSRQGGYNRQGTGRQRHHLEAGDADEFPRLQRGRRSIGKSGGQGCRKD